MLKNFKIAISGFFMAAADSVPGVSGGTIAFVLGFYDTFIGSLNALIKKDPDKRRNALLWLGKLGIGWVIGMGICSSIITIFFDRTPYAVFSLFFGFTVFAIPLVIWDEWPALKGHWRHLFFLILGAALVFFISMVGPGTAVDFGRFNAGMALYLFVSAAIGICAMVLPGISGSTILLIMGTYTPVITAVRGIFHLDFTTLPILFIFGMGVLLGLGSTVKLVEQAMTRHRSALVYLIIGLMIGSLFAIAQGPTALTIPREALSLGTFNWFWFFIGGIILAAMSYSRRFMEKRQALAAGVQ